MKHVNHFFRALVFVTVLASLGACASGPGKPQPAELGPNPALLGVRSAWVANLGAVDFALEVPVNGGTVALASSGGTVLALDARSGATLWRAELAQPLSAGVGSDGHYAAVVTRNNDLVLLEAGREVWRKALGTQVFTAPLVAGERVFVLGADRSLAAFDARSGTRLWRSHRPGDALVLRQAGILKAVGNTLVVGMSGHLVGVNPLNGNPIWDAPLAIPRGTNDIERLVDVVAGVGRNSDVLCVRAFQAAVGCVDTVRGSLVWKRPASGSVGLTGDDKLIFGVEDDGRVLAWRSVDGEPVWLSDRLRYRQLGTPLLIGRSVAVGDAAGLVHLLSRADGATLTRLSTDGSALASAPVLAVGTLVVVTRKGGVFGFVPE